jgi:hypothetical protein
MTQFSLTSKPTQKKCKKRDNSLYLLARSLIKEMEGWRFGPDEELGLGDGDEK